MTALGILGVHVILENGFAWRNEKDKFFLDKEDDEATQRAEAKARSAKTGIWKIESRKSLGNIAREKLGRQKKRTRKPIKIKPLS